MVDTQSYKTSIQIAEILRKSKEEAEAEKTEKKLENLKCEILKKEIFSHETFITLVEGTLLKNESNKIVDDDGKNRVLVDVGYFINLHKNITKKDMGK